MSEVQGFKEPALPWYSDQILPFDVTIAAANEYGAAASAKLFGVEILNEGFGASVDDSALEMQATFVAHSVSLTRLHDLGSDTWCHLWDKDNPSSRGKPLLNGVHGPLFRAGEQASWSSVSRN